MLLLSLLCAPGLAADAEESEDAPAVEVRVEGPLRFEDVPAPDPALAEQLQRYQAIRGARLAGWAGLDAGLYITTRFGDVGQVHHVARPGGARTQVTFDEEPASGVSPHPLDPRRVALQRDTGGNEAYQILLLDRQTGELLQITDGVHRHSAATWSWDGTQLAYAGNARNGRDFDIYVAPAADPTAAERVLEAEGYWVVAGWSQDGQDMTVLNYVSSTRSALWALDLASGEKRQLTPEGEVRVGGGAFVPGERTVLVTSDHEGEFVSLYEVDLDTDAWTPLTAELEWDVTGVSVAPDGRTVAVSVNERGWSRLYLLDRRKGTLRPAPGLPADAQVGAFGFHRTDHRRLLVNLYGPTRPSDIYELDVRKGELAQWTMSETGGLAPSGFTAPESITWSSFDGTSLDGFVYRPEGEGPHPAVVSIHGGPEAQARPYLSGTYQTLLDQGIAVVIPNVRGSAGYGKSFLKLDNGMKREDSVRDIGTLLDWVADQPDLDQDRVAVMGGSYGGYMVLASLIHFGDRLAGGIDVVGISDFVTFLENTKAYRRDLRRVEYGDERDPEMRAHLEKISPLARASELTRPLFVVHGANDPRVPVGEAEQIVAAARAQGAPVQYLRAENEGHGFSKKANRDVLQVLEVQFLVELLQPGR